MGKKGMLKADKVKAIMSVFHGDHKDGSMMFNEKDLLRICSKQKGVVEQSVMDVMKDEMDGMYECDMLGSSKIYWSLKSKDVQSRKKKREELDEETAKEEASIARLTEENARLTEENAGGLSETARDSLIKKKAMFVKGNEALRQNLEGCVDEDYHQLLKRVKTISQTGADRWTDGIYILSKYATDSGEEKTAIDSQLEEFGLKDAANLDYIE